MKSLRNLSMFVVSIILAGCSREPDLAPPEIHLGQDTCHACGMIVSDARFAAAVVIVRNGVEEKIVFDDLGEMLDFKPPQADEVVKYVHDYDTSKWLPIDRADITKQDKIKTPMATGYLARLRK